MNIKFFLQVKTIKFDGHGQSYPKYQNNIFAKFLKYFKIFLILSYLMGIFVMSQERSEVWNFDVYMHAKDEQ